MPNTSKHAGGFFFSAERREQRKRRGVLNKQIKGARKRQFTDPKQVLDSLSNHLSLLEKSLRTEKQGSRLWKKHAREREIIRTRISKLLLQRPDLLPKIEVIKATANLIITGRNPRQLNHLIGESPSLRGGGRWQLNDKELTALWQMRTFFNGREALRTYAQQLQAGNPEVVAMRNTISTVLADRNRKAQRQPMENPTLYREAIPNSTWGKVAAMRLYTALELLRSF